MIRSVTKQYVNPLTVADRKFHRRLCMWNLVVTDISVHEKPFLQTGISLIKNIYQSGFFFYLQVSILYKLFVSEISLGNVIIILTYHLFINHSRKFLFFLKKKTLPGKKQMPEYNLLVKGSIRIYQDMI